MTVSTTTNKNTATGDGATTIFTFTFALQQSADLDVYIAGVLQGSGYTVVINSNGVGGTITFSTAPANGAALIFARVVDLTQTTALPVEGNIPEDTLEDMSDKLTMIGQQIKESVDRALTIPITSTGVITALSAPEALKILRWNSTANAIEQVSAAQAFNDSVPAGGGGNVLGPATSTARTLVLWNSANGQTVKAGPAIGNAGEVLTSNGAGADPSFQSLGFTNMCDGRLTPVTGDPFGSGTAITTLYFTPYNGNQVAVYTGSVWQAISFSEISIAIPSTANQLYDVFVYNNAGTLALQLVAWTNDTTRATALTRVNGVLCKSGDTGKRFVGCVRTTPTAGQTEVSQSRLLIANYQRRFDWHLVAVDTTDAWASTNAAWHTANGSTALGVARVQFITPWADGLIEVEHTSLFVNSSSYAAATGIGLDSTSVNSAQIMGSYCGATIPVQHRAVYKTVPAVGFHYLQVLEIAGSAGTTTYYGDNGLTFIQTGMLAKVAY